MRKKISLLFILLLLFYSCFEKRENVVNVNNIDDRIYVGMSKEELKKEIGEPVDSIVINKEIGKHMLMYYTNDFTDYRLYIYFDKDDEIISYNID